MTKCWITAFIEICVTLISAPTFPLDDQHANEAGKTMVTIPQQFPARLEYIQVTFDRRNSAFYGRLLRPERFKFRPDRFAPLIPPIRSLIDCTPAPISLSLISIANLPRFSSTSPVHRAIQLLLIATANLSQISRMSQSTFALSSYSALAPALTAIRIRVVEEITVPRWRGDRNIMRAFDIHRARGFPLDDARRGRFNALQERDAMMFDDYAFGGSWELAIYIPLRGYQPYERRISQGGAGPYTVASMLLLIAQKVQEMIEEYQGMPCNEADFEVGPGKVQLKHLIIKNVYQRSHNTFGVTLLVDRQADADVVATKYL